MDADFELNSILSALLFFSRSTRKWVDISCLDISPSKVVELFPPATTEKSAEMKPKVRRRRKNRLLPKSHTLRLVNITMGREKIYKNKFCLRGTVMSSCFHWLHAMFPPCMSILLPFSSRQTNNSTRKLHTTPKCCGSEMEEDAKRFIFSLHTPSRHFAVDMIWHTANKWESGWEVDGKT